MPVTDQQAATLRAQLAGDLAGHKRQLAVLRALLAGVERFGIEQDPGSGDRAREARPTPWRLPVLSGAGRASWPRD